MNVPSVKHLGDGALLRQCDGVVARSRGITAELLAYLGEIDARQLYRQAGYPSMFAFCVGRYHFSEQSAYKRIQAARAARRFPVLFEAVADGRLHLSAIVVLASHFTTANVDAMIAAATHRTKAEVEALVAERHPKPDLPTRIRCLGPKTAEPVFMPAGDMLPLVTGSRLVAPQRSPGVDATQSERSESAASDSNAPEASPSGSGAASLPQLSPGIVARQPEPAALSRAEKRYGIQFTITQQDYERLELARALLGHRVPGADAASVFRLALEELVSRLERRKFAATSRPRAGRSETCANARCIPARVKREVWQRDGGRCTFVAETGHRCASRSVEFDHIREVARGGESTASNLRLRCRAHNQLAAERTFGEGFMRVKRNAAAVAAP